MEEEFSLDTALELGTLPLVASSPSPKDQLEAYVQLYLKEEIQAEALVRNLPGFARFLPIAALCHAQTINRHAQTINLSSIARDAGIASTTAEGYLKILEDTLLGFRLPGFTAKLRVKERVNPRWYWLDAGVARAAKNAWGRPLQEECGTLFEGYVAMLLRAAKDYKILDYQSLAFWSLAGGMLEVDFILERTRERIAIEVKHVREPQSKHLRGLRAIAELKHLRRRILVYPGTENRRTKDGIEILGFPSFVEEVRLGLQT